MKKTLAVLSALALAIPVPLAMPSAAYAQIAPGQGAPGACRTDVLPFDPTANLGECVSSVNTFWNSPDHGFVTHICDAVLEIDPNFFELFYDSFSECVRDGADAFGF